jgi:hypothetical protein
MAQPGPATPTPNDPDRNSPAHKLSLDIHMVVRPDLTATVNSTTRFKILRESAIRALGQQSVPFVESLNPLEVVEAYTEKPDGRKLFVEAANILTRDAATGLNAVYQRDAKVKTIIFPDIEVGDTLVYVLKVNRIDKRFPGHLFFHAVLPRSSRSRSDCGLPSAVKALPIPSRRRAKAGTTSSIFSPAAGRWKSREPFRSGIAILGS